MTKKKVIGKEVTIPKDVLNKLHTSGLLMTKEDVISVIKSEMNRANRIAKNSRNSVEYYMCISKVNVCRKLIKRIREY